MFPARVYECDAVIYANRAIHGDISEALDAAHLGFDLLEYKVAELGQRLSPPASPIIILTYVSVAAGLAGIFFFWLLLQRLGASTGATVLLSGALMFSYSYWHFSLQAESHMIASLLIILLALQVHRLLGRPTVRNALATSLILTLATLVHQTSVIVSPAILVGLMMTSISWRSKCRVMLALVASSVVLIGVPTLYWGFYVSRAASSPDLWSWLSSSQLNDWGQWRIMGLPAAVIGLTRSFIGSHYLLGFEPLSRLAIRLFPFSSLQDELRAASLVPVEVRLVLVPVQAALLLFFGWVALMTLKGLRSLPAVRSPYAGFLIAWALTLSVFVLWWAPERSEFWIAILIPCMLLLGLPGLSRPVSGMSLPLAVIIVAAIFAVNFLGSIYPQSARGTEIETRVAVGIDAIVETGDIVVSDCSFRGRASKYVPSFERMNLLDPAAGSGEDGALERIIPYALSTVDSLLDAAEHDNRTVYIIMSPLSEEPNLRLLYEGILDAVQREFEMSGPVPVRAPLELRRIESRKP
jgi:hypothetical protein